MGASAGRVLLIPKGDWNAETTYTGLDWVRHNGAAWVCKNTCTGIEPTEENSDNWQMMSRDGTEITVDAEISDQSENPVQNKAIKKYVDEHTPEVADMTGATATQNGAHGLVPAPQIGDEKKALLGDGTWGSVDAILTFKTKEEYDSAVANDEIPDGAKVIKEYDDGDSTAIIDVDTVMSDTSENPVQNKVIKKYVDEHTTEITVDASMSDQSENPVQNKVIKEYIDNHVPDIIVDSEVSDTSTNPVQNKAMKAYVDAKKVPTFGVENVISDILIVGSDGNFITPTNTWEGSYNYLSCVLKAPAGQTSINVSLNIPANSIVLLSSCSQGGEDIRHRSPNIFSNIGGNSAIIRSYNLYIEHSVAASYVINFYPLVIHLG